MNEFLKLYNKIVIRLKIIPLSPLNIKFSPEEKEKDNEKDGVISAIITTEKGNYSSGEKGSPKDERKGEIYIPGSTLKGLFRDRFLTISEENEYINRLFGFVDKDKSRKSRLFIQDAFLADEDTRKKFYEGKFEDIIKKVTSSRSITPIDHFSSKAKVPLQYEYTMEEFISELTINNASQDDLKAVYFLIRDSINNEIRIGNSKTRGFGLIKFEIEDLKYEQFKSERDELKVFEEYFSIDEKKSKKIGEKYLSKSLHLKEEFKGIDVENPNDFIKALFEEKGGN